MRRRRDVGAAVGDGLLERGQIDERLEDRSRLAARRDRAVVLRLVVGAAADERENLAGLRIDGDERRLGVALALAPRQQLVDLRQAVRAPRPARGAAGADRASCTRRPASVVVVVRPGYCSSSVWSTKSTKYGASASSARCDDGERLARRAVGRVLVDEAGVDHRLQHDVAPLLAARRVVERRQRRRRLDDAGNRRRFGERDVADVLAEEQARGLGDAEDGERSALAERDVVQVHLEDLVLRRAARRGRPTGTLLEQLASDATARARVSQRHALELRQEDVANQLLRDRAAAGQYGAPAGRVGEDRAGDADRIDARDARRSGDPRSRAPPASCAAGIAESATGRRFSRSPLMSAVSTGASSVRRSVGLAAELERPARGPRGRGGVVAGWPARRAPAEASRWKTTRTTWPLNSAPRGMMRDRRRCRSRTRPASRPWARCA